MALMGKYIYCFIKEKENIKFGISEITTLKAPIYTINYQEISAVVSDAPVIDYVPKRKNIMAHQKVISTVMEKYTVIPVAFGTVADNKKDIITIMSSSYDKFIANLKYLNDKVELGLRVTWNEEFFNKDIEDAQISKLKKIVSGKEENTVLAEKIQLGKLVEASIINRREDYIDKIYNQLAEISAEAKTKENIPIKTVFNGYFLVEKSKESDFDEKVKQLSDAFKDKLIFHYTGPWPPYNFVNMNISL